VPVAGAQGNGRPADAEMDRCEGVAHVSRARADVGSGVISELSFAAVAKALDRGTVMPKVRVGVRDATTGDGTPRGTAGCHDEVRPCVHAAVHGRWAARRYSSLAAPRARADVRRVRCGARSRAHTSRDHST
jgi:hypothetical protein